MAEIGTPQEYFRIFLFAFLAFAAPAMYAQNFLYCFPNEGNTFTIQSGGTLAICAHCGRSSIVDGPAHGTLTSDGADQYGDPQYLYTSTPDTPVPIDLYLHRKPLAVNGGVVCPIAWPFKPSDPKQPNNSTARRILLATPSPASLQTAAQAPAQRLPCANSMTADKIFGPSVCEA